MNSCIDKLLCTNLETGGARPGRSHNTFRGWNANDRMQQGLTFLGFPAQNLHYPDTKRHINNELLPTMRMESELLIICI